VEITKSYTDRSKSTKIKDLKIGEEQTIILTPFKYNFPRIRNLPNRIYCKDDTGELDCIFFNSYEGYIKKILPLNKEVTVSGKVGILKTNIKLQIQNMFRRFNVN
jgi:ATP-dependent DNA helicase RecG